MADLDDTLSLSRQRIEPRGPSFAPAGQSDRATLSRQAIAEFLVGAYGVPDAIVANRVDTLSLRERVFLELEMTEREKRLHTFDYDPLQVP
jgi:hypothetical protein